MGVNSLRHAKATNSPIQFKVKNSPREATVNYSLMRVEANFLID